MISSEIRLQEFVMAKGKKFVHRRCPVCQDVVSDKIGIANDDGFRTHMKIHNLKLA